MSEDEMVGLHHWLSGHEFEQALGDGEGQGSLGVLLCMASLRVGQDWATEQHCHPYIVVLLSLELSS